LIEPPVEKNPKPPQSVKTALDKLRQIQNKKKTSSAKLPTAPNIYGKMISSTDTTSVPPQIKPQDVKLKETVEELSSFKDAEEIHLSANEKANIVDEVTESEVVMTDSLKESIKALDDLMNEKPLMKEANKPVMQPVMSSKEPKIIVHSEFIKKNTEQPIRAPHAAIDIPPVLLKK
jgi:hypothetical protein